MDYPRIEVRKRRDWLREVVSEFILYGPAKSWDVVLVRAVDCVTVLASANDGHTARVTADLAERDLARLSFDEFAEQWGLAR